MPSFTPFCEGRASTVFENQLQQVLNDIDSLDNDYVLNASAVELEKHFVEKARIEPLQLHSSERVIENQRSVPIDVTSHYRQMFGHDHDRPVRVPGTQVEILIPFAGDPALWKVRPSTFTLSGYPEISVKGNAILINFQFADGSDQANSLKPNVERSIKALEGAIQNLHVDVGRFNESTPQAIRDRLTQKRQKAQAAIGAVVSLGIPMRQRSVPATYVAPTKRRDLPIRPPSAATTPYSPEPVLEEKEYQHILSVMRSMALVIERNPDSFRTLDEEAIRDHFLLQLNGHYEGGATGETFNKSGKTDILIRVQNRNVFIGECKFWGGQKRFGEAIDQLLAYLTWRDCKCAILVFNRTRDSSAVRQKMHEVICQRKEWRKTVLREPHGDANYVFIKDGNQGEPGREIMITTQLYDVPSASDENE